MEDKPFISRKKVKLEFTKKSRDDSPKLWIQDETLPKKKMESPKCGERNDAKHTSSSVKHGGGSSVLAWVCMTASGTFSLIFTDDGAHDGAAERFQESESK